MAKKYAKSTRAKRAFGQNFLVDQSYVTRIVASLNLSEGETVIEIGAGSGALTNSLLETGASVLAIEIDRDLHPVLRERFAGVSNFQLIADDVLKVEFESVFTENSITPPVKLVGNLPYNISTAILERVISARHLFSRAVFMFQREVVERITAPPGDSERGFYTVLIEAAFESEHLFDVPPRAFSPRPKVQSAVVALTPKPPSPGDDPAFRKLISAAFAQKRKTIFNNLKHATPNAETLLANAAIDPRRRAETLTLDEWFRLYEQINRSDTSNASGQKER